MTYSFFLVHSLRNVRFRYESIGFNFLPPVSRSGALVVPQAPLLHLSLCCCLPPTLFTQRYQLDFPFLISDTFRLAISPNY